MVLGPSVPTRYGNANVFTRGRDHCLDAFGKRRNGGVVRLVGGLVRRLVGVGLGSRFALRIRLRLWSLRIVGESGAREDHRGRYEGSRKCEC